jgi:hypothetical protein
VNATGGAPQALTSGETIEWNPVETSDGKTVLCLGSTATSPSMPYRVTPNGRESIAKNAVPPEFPESQLVVPRQIVFKSEDGLDIHGQLFVPKNQTERGPALIFTHGGPIRQMLLGWHYMQYYYNAYGMNQYLASKGYTVLSVNYRLGIMYGRAFREPPNSVWRGASEYKDVVAGAKFLQTLENVDQATLARFITEGFFLSHIKRMRRIYAERREVFIKQFNEVLGDRFVLQVPEGGLNMVAWLKREKDLPAISSATRDIGVKPSPLSFYCIRATPKPAFVFGFAGWTPAQIRESLVKLASSLRRAGIPSALQ